MKRRTLLGVGLGTVAMAGTTAVAQGTTTFVMVTDRAEAANALAARVAAVTDGRITIDVRAAQTTDAAGFLGQVSGGDADMYLTAEESFVETNKAFGVFSSMPGGMSPSELESWIVVSDGRFMWDLLGEEHGVKAFLAGDDGTLPIWSREPLTSVDSLTSGNVGSVGLGVTMLQEMGAANAVDIRTSGVDIASLDAFDGLNVDQMAAAGLLDTFPHMTASNAGRPGSAISVGVNLDKWNSLSEDDQLVIERCITAEHGERRSLANHNSVAALSNAGGSITAHKMPQEIWDAQIAAASATMIQIIESGDLGADIGDAYLYFISDVAGWSEIGEAAYFVGRKQALSQ